MQGEILISNVLTGLEKMIEMIKVKMRARRV